VAAAVVAVVAAGAVVAEDAAVAPAAPVALVVVHPSDTAVSAETRLFRLHDKVEDLIGRARSSTRPILVFVGPDGSPAANISPTYRKMLTRRRRCAPDDHARVTLSHKQEAMLPR
jgi:hypothetical protein